MILNALEILFIPKYILWHFSPLTHPIHQTHYYYGIHGDEETEFLPLGLSKTPWGVIEMQRWMLVAEMDTAAGTKHNGDIAAASFLFFRKVHSTD